MNNDRMKESMEKFRQLKQLEQEKKSKRSFEKVKRCPNCGESMVYIYGETFECPACKATELTDFGKVRQYLEENGVANAAEVSKATGVPMRIIDNYLRQGRVEIPDGSSVYIHCEMCNTEIRYGRYCIDCSRKLSSNIAHAFLNPEAGEKPKHKAGDGAMHIRGKDNKKR